MTCKDCINYRAFKGKLSDRGDCRKWPEWRCVMAKDTACEHLNRGDLPKSKLAKGEGTS